MKTKVCTILLFIITFVYFSNDAYASNNAIVYLTSKSQEVNLDDEIEITVNLENSKISACNFSMYFEKDKLEFINNTEEDNTNVVDNRINYVWFDTLGGEGAKEGNIAKFKFKAKENGLAIFTINGEFYSSNGQMIETNFKETQVQIGKKEISLQNQIQEEQGTNQENSNVDLKVLRVDREGLTPNFEKNVEEYYLTIPNNIQNIEVLAISENPNAIVEVKGNTNLQNKLNDIIIQVTSSDKTKSKSYIIHVSKTENFETANANLEILAVENALLTPPFDAVHTDYKLEVPYETKSLNIFAVPENENASVEIIGKDDIKEGKNEVKIIVKAQNGFTKKNYKIEVNRRNLEEEKKYQEEQSKQKEELENAYKLEKISATVNETQETSNQKQSKNSKNIAIWIIGIVIVTLAIIVLALKMRKRKK